MYNLEDIYNIPYYVFRNEPMLYLAVILIRSAYEVFITAHAAYASAIKTYKEGNKIVCTQENFNLMQPIDHYRSPRPSMPGSNAGKLLLVTGGRSINTLNLKSQGGSGGLGDHGSNYLSSLKMYFAQQNDPEIIFQKTSLSLNSGPAGIGGLGGYPGIVKVYLLDKAEKSCINNCWLYMGDTGSTGAYGRNKDGTLHIDKKPVHTEPKKFDGNVQITKTLTHYKKEMHSTITFLNFDTITDFFNKIDSSTDLQQFSNTLDFAQEMLAIVSESHTDSSISKRVLSSRYSSLMKRLELYSKSLSPVKEKAKIICKENTCITEFSERYIENSTNRQALFTIYAAAALQLDFLKETSGTGFIVDISSFFIV